MHGEAQGQRPLAASTRRIYLRAVPEPLGKLN
jgi:hypothetical protein